MRQFGSVQILAVSIAFILPLSSYAGVWSSGGGNAVVCRNEAGTIESVELLDLYEGRVLSGLQPVASEGSALEQAKAAARRIDHANGGFDFSRLVEQTQTKLHFLPADTGLRPIDDSDHLVLPKACRISAVARYDQGDEIFVDQEIWSAMSEMNRGALLLHETLYWVFRMMGDKTSDHTRSIVARAFAGAEFVPVDEGVPTNAEHCIVKYNPETEMPWAVFGAYEDPAHPGSMILQFEILNGKPVVSKTTMALPGVRSLRLNKQDVFMMGVLDSIIDKNLSLSLRLKPTKTQTGLIGLGKDLVSAAHPFLCRAADGHKTPPVKRNKDRR